MRAHLLRARAHGRRECTRVVPGHELHSSWIGKPLPVLIVGSRIDASVEPRWAYMLGKATFESGHETGELVIAFKKPEVTADDMRKVFGASRRVYFHAGVSGREGYA